MTENSRLIEPGVLRDTRDALQESEERFRQLVANIHDHAIFLLDAGGRVSSWNVGAERMKGYTEAEILGKHFSVFYDPEAVEREWPEFELSIAREKGRIADEGWRVRKDGTRFWASTVMTAIRGADGTVRGFLKIVRDLTDRHDRKVTQQESEEQFRLLVDAVEEYAIFLLDLNGNVRSWNRGAELIKGYAASEIIGVNFSRFYPASSVLQGKPAWELEMATLYGSFEDEGWRIRKDGSQFWANVVITALWDKAGNPRGFAKVTRDMTERRRIEDLENADRQKDQFLALLAHELRNPLAPIRAALAVLRRPNVTPDETKRARNIAERQLHHMSRLLDDLLDVSRIREGRIELKMETLDVGAIMRSAAQAAASVVEARHHTLTIVDPKDKLFVKADPVRIEQVLGNLLNNAAKYTDPGGQIRISAEKIVGEVLIRVRDNGIGIEPLLIPRVFDLFVQAERRVELSAGGVGIGLSLVKKLIELHGGRVEAISAGPGRGSEFIVALPAVGPKTEERVTVAETGSSPRPRVPLRVLLVDDNPDSADGLAMLLELQGHETRVAYDGETALESARTFRPHAALLDIGMPHMDGYELARRLRAAPETKDTMLVAMTGWGQEEDLRKGREAGFAHHLVKPFDPSAVEELLADLHSAE